MACLRRCGFTLVELLVVMAIVATLLSITVPAYFRHLDTARENALRQTLNVVRDALDKYHADTGLYPNSLDDLVSRRYLRRKPADPITESDETWVLLPPPNTPEIRAVWDIRSGAEGNARDGSAYRDW